MPPRPNFTDEDENAPPVKKEREISSSMSDIKKAKKDKKGKKDKKKKFDVR